MMKITYAILLAAAVAIGAFAPGVAATTPKPRPTRFIVHLPPVKLHAEYIVEVNAKGQVSRVEKARGNNKYPMWNAQTYGNVLQMWIRHADGSAEVGLYKVTYDYDPKTTMVHRGVDILSRGGKWANDTGAADDMMQKAEQERREQDAAAGKALPPLQNIVGATPTPHA